MDRLFGFYRKCRAKVREILNTNVDYCLEFKIIESTLKFVGKLKLVKKIWLAIMLTRQILKDSIHWTKTCCGPKLQRLGCFVHFLCLGFGCQTPWGTLYSHSPETSISSSRRYPCYLSECRFVCIEYSRFALESILNYHRRLENCFRHLWPGRNLSVWGIKSWKTPQSRLMMNWSW